ncbi:hypothetical protein BGZ83_010263 [Gryganskiella cystojenkinii]|nr:hypothetical protein BGZ83_010263 [Gryganskiella cystojenkinii]
MAFSQPCRPVSGSSGMTSYFDLIKPISIPGNHLDPSTAAGFLDRDPNDVSPLPEHLQSFHGTGISDARLKQFNWLHPKNYSEDGSLGDEYTFSPYGTSVSSPRGDEWEIVDPGPRKSIDQLWDEVFEYQQRIKQLERASLAEQQFVQSPEEIDDLVQFRLQALSANSSYSSPMSMATTANTTVSIATTIGSLVSKAATTTVALTQVDKSEVYATRKGYRSDRGSALRLLQAL